MPNHFHILLEANEVSIQSKKIGNIRSTALSNGFRMLQSTYAQVVNTERSEFGSLFKQKAKAKFIDRNTVQLLNAFIYIHQNPLAAGLVYELEDWEYSSFIDFAGLRKGTLCNMEHMLLLLGFEKEELFTALHNPLPEAVIKSLY